jgi:hypothetical protein
MRKLMWLLPAAVLWGVPPAAQAQYARPPYFPGSGVPTNPGVPGIPGGGDRFGRPGGVLGGDPFDPRGPTIPGVPGIPGVDDRFGRPAGVPGIGDPFDPLGGSGPRFGPADPLDRLRRPRRGFGRPAAPGPTPPVPWLPPQNLAPPGPFVKPPPDDKDRDKLNGLGAIPHVPHIHIPSGEGWGAGEKVALAPEAVRFGKGAGGWAKFGGGGLLAAVGGLLRALFGLGRKKDDGAA